MKAQTKKEKVQQIAEILFTRVAAKNGDTLPDKFWRDERYARDYRVQLIKINAMLKLYDAEAIIKALNSPKGKAIWSITAPWLDPLIALEQKNLDRLQEQKAQFIQAADEFAASMHSPMEINEICKEKDSGAIRLKQKKSSILDKLDN